VTIPSSTTVTTEEVVTIPSSTTVTTEEVVTIPSSTENPGNFTWLFEPCRGPDPPTCPPGVPPLILLSLDGFRMEYIDRKLTPVINRLKECGIRTPYMRPIYPSKTFPNHYSIVTGLYGESHGIVDNSIYDMELRDRFSLSRPSKFDPRWWQGEPLWNTMKKQGKKSASFMWPGCDVQIQGMYPDIYVPYNGSISFEYQVDMVLGWLDLPKEERPEFISMYMFEPDTTGHKESPFGPELPPVLARMDGLVGKLMDGLLARRMDQCVNLVLVSDHGMQETSCSKTNRLDSWIDVNNYYIFEGQAGRITSKYLYKNREYVHVDNPEPADNITAHLECKDERLLVYKKEDAPKRLHHANNKRIDEVLLKNKDKWLVFRKGSYNCNNQGAHGWDNNFDAMHALFTAHGPGFKSQFDMEPLENIELYNMMADLLDVEPASNNGTKGSLNYIMTSPKPQPIREVSDVSCSGDFQSDVVTDCSCDNLRNLTMKSESELNEQLKLTAEEVTQSWSKHHPYGINSPNSSCYFVQRDYVNTYNAQFRMPLLSTFIYDKMPSVFPSDCVRGDPRAKNGRNCSDFISEEQNITHAFLYPPGVSATDDGRLDAAITSNLVPMYNGFQSGIWKFLYDVLEEYREHYSDIHVMVGPAWDYDADGKPDDINNITQLVQDSGVPIPSHFYMSMIRCRVGDSVQQCTGELDVQSFILPHKQKVMNCMKSIDYLQEHVARVRDIELLTGFEFFVNTSFEDAVKIRTFLPGHLWSRDSWVEEPCMEEMKCPAGFSLPPVILVCLDGFRADYLLRNFTPTLGKLASCGTHAPYMRAVYPTKTFPNHYSIVTGLYPESHGIIDNNMYDMKMNKRFSISSSEARNPEWWKGEPIWNTLQKQNKTAATFFWPGSDVKIKGMYPNYYKPYDGKISYQARIDQILTWLDLPEGERPDFLTLYFNEPDLAGHIWGPENKPAMRDILEEVDGYIGKLMNGLLHRDLHNCVNIIVVADHGMAETNCDQVVVLKDWHYPLNNVYVWEGPFGRIANKYKYSSGGMAPLNETEQTPTSKILDDLKCKSEHMKVFDKHWLPKRHHYANNDRIDDVILDMDAEWLVGRYSYRGCT
ncbi:unnamed protein product, partial [Owenia fusiformis]